MLKFDRKSFRSGILKVKEPVMVENMPAVKEYSFKTSDKGKDFSFEDEAYVLAKYSHLFTQV